MDIICASICYRGYVEDEVVGTLQNAPALGYRFMEIHGPMVWSVEAVEQFEVDKIKREVAASGMVCRGLYPPGWGGTDAADVAARARAIAQCVEYTRLLGGKADDFTVEIRADRRVARKAAPTSAPMPPAASMKL